MIRFFFLVCLLGILTHCGMAAAADITLSANKTPETTPLTISSAAVVGTVTAIDFPGDTDISYGVQETWSWAIDKKSGMLSRKANFSINLEAPTTSLTATVTATDNNSLTTVTKTFTITIINVDEPPGLVKFTSGGSINENATGEVGTLSAIDSTAGDAIKSFSTTDSRFNFSGSTLLLKSGNTFNFENTPDVKLTIRAWTTSRQWSSDLWTETEVSVTIINVNEPPSSPTLSAISLKEELAGAVVGTLNSSDVDSGDTRAYSVPEDSGYRIIIDSENKIYTLALALGKKLNFEKTTPIGDYVSRSVTVTVKDSDGLTATSSFTVTPDNVNEAPTDLTFTSSQFNEETTGKTVGSLSSKDNDLNDPAEYSVPTGSGYHIIGGNLLALEPDKKVDLEGDGGTGDYASKVVRVTVTDLNGNGLSTSLNVTVTPTNVNEAPGQPTLSGKPFNEETTGVEVGVLSSIDVDKDDTAKYSVSVNSGYRIIAPNILALAIGKKLDREDQAERDDYVSRFVEVTVTDNNGDANGLSSKATVTVNEPNNVNESPIDLRFTATAFDEETTDVVVGTLSSRDVDKDTTVGFPKYSVPDNSGYRIIPPNTLALNADKKLNFESGAVGGSYPSRSVTVTVTDAGNLSISLPVTVIPTDINEAPTGLAISRTSCVEESLGAIIGTLTRNDDANDEEIYSVPKDSGYRIIKSDDYSKQNILALNPDKQLNYESDAVGGSYASRSVTVTVADRKGLTATLPVTVTPVDINEPPTGLAISRAICVEETFGAEVGTLSSSDVDTLEPPAYSVPDHSGYHIIPPNILALKADKKLNFESLDDTGDYASREVTVTATDKGGLTATLIVTVAPTNANDAPTGLTISGTSCLEESPGATIGTLSSLDADTGDSAIYSVPTGSGYQIIDRNKLALMGDKKLNLEDPAVIGAYASRTVLVTVTDSGKATATLPVTVTPINVNEPPTTIRFADGGQVNENDAEARIAELSHDDPDKGDSISYQLVDPSGSFRIDGTELHLKPSSSLNFEAGALIPVSIVATDDIGLTCTTTLLVTVIDHNDTPTLPTWATTSIEVIDASAGLALTSAADVLVDEDTQANFRTYPGMRLEISFTSGYQDQLEFVVPSDLQSAYYLLDDQATVALSGTTTAIATIQSSQKRMVMTLAAGRQSTLAEVSSLLRMVSFRPSKLNLTNRPPLAVQLSVANDQSAPAWTSTRTITLDTANLPPSITPSDAILVTRFGQVSITPAMLGIADEHPELGLTLVIDYPTLNGKLFTSSRALPLGADDRVEVTYDGVTGSLSLDLIYVPDTGNSLKADACFLSILDHGSKAGVPASTYLRTNPTRALFTINPGVVPVVTKTDVPPYLEGADAIALVNPNETLQINGVEALANANLGGWNLYVSYAPLKPTTGPDTITEILAVRAHHGITVDGDGRTVKLNGRTIAQIDSSAKGSESALLLILSSDISASEVLVLAKSITYRDTSPRLPVSEADPRIIRKLYLGFLQKIDARNLGDVEIKVTRTGIDTAPLFTDGSRRTVITVSNEPILGSSILEDIDTAATPTISIAPLTGDLRTPRATVAIQRGPEDTTHTYRTTLGWKLQRDPEVTGDQDFILRANINGTTLSQTITLSPRSGSDLALAIASDAPLALIKPAGASAPITRALRVRRGAVAVDDAAFFLLGDAVPPWITIDSTAGTLSYDLADSRASAGTTYTFSVLATAGTTAAEQPVVLRVVGQPVLSGTN